MVAKPVLLTTRSFPTQGAAEAFYRTMLRSYRIGDRVSEADGIELLALLDRHPEYSDKVGRGLSHFEVMMTPENTPCFRLVRTDGTGTDFSFYTAIKGRPPGRKQEVMAALRRTVHGDILAARAARIAERGSGDFIECAETGEVIAIADSHLDHRPPKTFELLVVTFLAQRGMDFDAVPITVGTDEQTAPDVTDDALAEEFGRYHRSEAVLDLVKKSINLAQSSQHRLRSKAN